MGNVIGYIGGGYRKGVKEKLKTLLYGEQYVFHDKIIENVKNNLLKKYSEVDTRDGVKAIIDEDTWILIRKSNTEDIIRISGESNNEEKCKNIIKDTKQMVKENYDKIK